MDASILGIDLTDNEAGAALSDSDTYFHVPTAICRDRKHDIWYIGEEAYEKALAGKGILTDKLLALSVKGGTATIRGVRYEARELLCRFLSLVKEQCLKESNEQADTVVIVLPDYRKQVSELLGSTLAAYGFSPEQTFFISREESFLYYVMSQPREIRTAEVGLFDLSDQSLSFYELSVKQEKTKRYVWAEREELEEAFTTSILSSASGQKLADRIMTSAAERLLKGKLFSAVFLTGKGFESYDWADGLMRVLVRSRRKVFLDLDLFIKGALLRGQSLSGGKGDPGFIPLCSGRSSVSVSLQVEKNGRKRELPLIHAGDPLSSAGVSFRLLPDRERALDLNVDSFRGSKRRAVRVALDFLPDREQKTCFVDVRADFQDDRSMKLALRNAGFGDLYPASDEIIEKEVPLWE